MRASLRRLSQAAVRPERNIQKRLLELNHQLKAEGPIRGRSMFENQFFQTPAATVLGTAACCVLAFGISPLLNYSKKGLPSTVTDPNYLAATKEYLHLQGANPISHPENNNRGLRDPYMEKFKAREKD